MREEEQIYHELDPKDYGVLAVYGNALLEGFENPAYSKEHVSNFLGEDVGKKMDILEAVGHLERYQHSNWNDDVYKIIEEVEDEAKGIMEHVHQEYGGDISEFMEAFNENDKEEISNMDVSIGQDQ